jgi:NAD binding domain of 6-phosphogluconate dehydrogenase
MMTSKRVGFIGLGSMGEPMALNLVRAGRKAIVWNRNPEKARALAAAGAVVAADAAEVFARADTVIQMLADGSAIDAVLDRRAPGFADRAGSHRRPHGHDLSCLFARARSRPSIRGRTLCRGSGLGLAQAGRSGSARRHACGRGQRRGHRAATA